MTTICGTKCTRIMVHDVRICIFIYSQTYGRPEELLEEDKTEHHTYGDKTFHGKNV